MCIVYPLMLYDLSCSLDYLDLQWSVCRRLDIGSRDRHIVMVVSLIGIVGLILLVELGVVRLPP